VGERCRIHLPIVEAIDKSDTVQPLRALRLRRRAQGFLGNRRAALECLHASNTLQLCVRHSRRHYFTTPFPSCLVFSTCILISRRYCCVVSVISATCIYSNYFRRESRPPRLASDTASPVANLVVPDHPDMTLPYPHHFKTPPSTATSWPVIYRLASAARKIQAPRISSGSATVLFMISSFQLSRR
jgi:hypothetical protein